MSRWLTEPVHDDVRDLWFLHEVVHQARTELQEVLVARTHLGTTLFCDQNPQSAELGQLHFHEAELLPAMALAERTRRVLVIGCSEGTVPQIAAQSGVERVDHVDLDPECVRICAEHLPYGFTPDEVRMAEAGSGAVKLHYEDGFEFIRRGVREGATYDVVVLDLPEEPEDESFAYLQRDFLVECRELLAPGGVLSTHVSRPYLSVPTRASAPGLQRPWSQFGEVFGTRVYFRSEEQPWAAIMLGRADEVERPVDRMRERLAELPYKPRTMDGLSLLRAVDLPMVLRGV